MTLTVTQNVTTLSLTATSNETSVVINPVVIDTAGVASSTGQIIIDGFYVDTIGKISSSFVVGDTFHGWDNDRFVRGKIVSLPVSLPDDLDNKAIVGLVENLTY